MENITTFCAYVAGSSGATAGQNGGCSGQLQCTHGGLPQRGLAFGCKGLRWVLWADMEPVCHTGISTFLNTELSLPGSSCVVACALWEEQV